MFILSLILSVVSSAASTYTCAVSYGETVPVRKFILKEGMDCKGYETAGAVIPEERVASQVEWNAGVETNQGLDTKLKRHVHHAGDRVIVLDTRYAKQSGDEFQFELDCSVTPCKGRVTEGTSPLKFAPKRLYDQRIASARGRLEITLGRREHLGFIARLFKDKVPYKAGQTIALSGSGEIKFLQEDPLFILDLGVDEQLYLTDEFSVRNAALEAKITCRKN